MFEKVLEEIKKYKKIIIHRHTKPDGDALGSQLGLKYILEENFPEKEIFVVGDTTERYAFMADDPMDDIQDSAYDGSLAFVLDTSAKSLISDSRYALAEKTIRIDHHIFVEEICDIEITDTTFESCCGMIAEFARETCLKLNSKAAKAIYTGMVTDSGRFRYDSTNSRTFALASFLTKQEFSTNDIYKNLYSDDFAFIRLRAQFVLKIQFTEKNVAFIYTEKEEAKSFGVDIFSISRGMVATMSDIKGVDIWVNFTETEDSVLCEIRSSKYNINPVAVKYGGGGHAKASGATLKNREEAMMMLDDLNKITEE
ncbi:MAG: bifunctional oligoribonuclease/PAP phosphatase NrnA [Ruminococcaceae bacterium]|nr:bifunctional oligoribonuclease/PAP phosphatase NrnA [Oscillospiraceae bacterium]